MNLKANLNVIKLIVVGHVDHGKSSLIGKLLHDLGEITDDKVTEIKQNCISRSVPFEWAFLLDSLKIERDQGVTVDTTQIFFKTKKRNFVFIDAPGHKEFLKNMVTGATQADIAFLIIDVNEGVKDQTKKHVYLLNLIGVRNIIILINKMDSVDYKKEKFLSLRSSIKKYLKNINITARYILPVSAKDGSNITQNSNMKWFKGSTVEDVLDRVRPGKLNKRTPLRMPVQDVYKIGQKRIIVGRIESGDLRVNDKIIISPSNMEAQISSIETWPSKQVKKCSTGECVGITLKNQFFVDKGNIISKKNSLPVITQSFQAKIFWFSKKPLNLNKSYNLKINTKSYEIKFTKIERIIETNNLSEKKRSIIERNDVAIVRIFSMSSICIDDFAYIQSTGCFSVESKFDVVGGGVIKIDKNISKQNLKKNIQKKYIKSEQSYITEIDRTSRFGHKPGIIWFTGLSGSGKSTLAREAEKSLFLRGYSAYILDGDNLRTGINKDLGFSKEERKENIRRTAEIAAMMSSAGFIVIVSLISPYDSDRKEAKSIKPKIFREVYIKASIKECERRDVKGYYLKAKSGLIKNFTGITAPYEEPNNPNLIIDTEILSLKESTKKLTDFIEKEFSNKKNKMLKV